MTLDAPRLAQAILNVGISTLDWHVSQIVKGEDGDADILAGLIATDYALVEAEAAPRPEPLDRGARLTFKRLVAALDVAGVDPATNACTLDDHHGVPFAHALWAALAPSEPTDG